MNDNRYTTQDPSQELGRFTITKAATQLSTINEILKLILAYRQSGKQDELEIIVRTKKKAPREGDQLRGLLNGD